MRKPTFCTCENKDADQLRGYREADLCLCFRFIDSTIPLLYMSEISSLLPSSLAVQPGLCRPGRKPECWFSHETAQLCYRSGLTFDCISCLFYLKRMISTMFLILKSYNFQIEGLTGTESGRENFSIRRSIATTSAMTRLLNSRSHCPCLRLKYWNKNNRNSNRHI